MKSLYLISISLFLLHGRVLADCTCEKEFEFVSAYYESNLPAYQLLDSTEQSRYQELKSTLYKALEDETTVSDCFKILLLYTEYFKDNHSRIQMPSVRVNEKNEDEVKEFRASELFENRERYDLSKLKNLEGIYSTKDSTYVIALVEDKTPLRDYIGVILSSKTPLWDIGQVKLELKEVEKDIFEALLYLRSHSIRHYNRYHLRDGMLGDLWFEIQKNNKEDYSVNYDRNFSVEMIHDSILYLRIPTFMRQNSARSDSFYTNALQLASKIPYLIIDVRNNGGGSDRNVEPLLPYLYDQPIPVDRVDLWVSPENIKVWENLYIEDLKDTINYSEDDMQWYEEEIARMKSAPLYSFISWSEAGEFTPDSISNFPKKVVVIQNQGCASSCETLSYFALHSDRAILAGENSGGYAGYGEVSEINTPCYGFQLFCSMSVFEKNVKYEVVGIPPEVKFSYEEDWISQAINLLSKN